MTNGIGSPKDFEDFTLALGLLGIVTGVSFGITFSVVIYSSLHPPVKELTGFIYTFGSARNAIG